MAFEQIPAELKELRQWVGYKLVDDPGKEKPRKVPINPHTLRGASAGNPDTWGSFEQATGQIGKTGTITQDGKPVSAPIVGIGFEFTEGGGYVGIDFDHCIENGALNEWAIDRVEWFNSYTELSPSGTGLHIICKGKLPGKAVKRPHAEMYDKDRYFTFTGDPWGFVRPIAASDHAVSRLYEELQADGKRPAEQSTGGERAAPSGTPAGNALDGMEAARRSKNAAKFDALYMGKWQGAYESQSQADQAFCNLLAFYCRKDAAAMDGIFRRSGLMRPKWDENHGGRTYGAMTIEKAIADTREVYEPRPEQDFEKEPAPKFYNENGKFLFNIMGGYLIQKYGACKINNAVHIYDNGVYRPGEDILHGYMLRMIPDLSDARRREVFKYIKVSLDTPVKQLSPPHLIPFRSKVYDVKADRFLEYGPDMVFLNRFPYDYDPAAPAAPLVDETIGEISCGDAEVVNLILESFGNCFYMLNAFRGSVMLYGPSGNNGKSTLLNMLSQLVGKENASFLSLQDTAERFRLIEIYGKAANIGDDIPDAYLPDSSHFKKLVTGETVIGERKGQDPIAFRPYAKMFFAMNALPPVSDKSKAFFSRILLIPLNNDFSKQGNMNVSLKDRTWTDTEMAYLTRLSVEGLKRLLHQGNFTRPACVAEAVQQYELESNPVAMFLAEYKNIIGEPTSSVYSDFKYWCWDNGHKNIMTQTKFVREARAVTGFITKDKRHPYFKGGVGKAFALPENEAVL